MSNWHGYLLITSLPPGWTNEQRQHAWDAMRTIGAQASDQPAHVNHTRLSLDGSALLVEALFDEAEITREVVVLTIATALQVQPQAVNAVIDYQIFTEGGTWEESRKAAIAFMLANQADWEPDEL